MLESLSTDTPVYLGSAYTHACPCAPYIHNQDCVVVSRLHLPSSLYAMLSGGEGNLAISALSWVLSEAVVFWPGEHCPSVDNVCLTLSSEMAGDSQCRSKTRGLGEWTMGRGTEGTACLTAGLKEHLS